MRRNEDELFNNPHSLINDYEEYKEIKHEEVKALYESYERYSKNCMDCGQKFHLHELHFDVHSGGEYCEKCYEHYKNISYLDDFDDWNYDQEWEDEREEEEPIFDYDHYYDDWFFDD